jgi:hypothetical protein
MDVKSAFFNIILEEDIYMVQPEGYEDNTCKGLVYKLKKAIYGLKHAQWVWNERFDIFLLGLSFRRWQANLSIYYLKIQ